MIEQARIAWRKEPILVTVCCLYILAMVGFCAGACLTSKPAPSGRMLDPDELLRAWGQTEPQTVFATTEERHSATCLWWEVGDEYSRTYRQGAALEAGATINAWKPLVARDAKRLSLLHGRTEAFWAALLWERCAELAWDHRGLRGWTDTHEFHGPFDRSAEIMLQCDWLACNTFKGTG